MPGLYSEGDNLVAVTTTNALHSEQVRAHVGDRPLVLCGMWSESCVVNTARAAADANHEVLVFSPCCAGHRPVCWLAMLKIQQLYGEVVHRLRFQN